MIRKLIVLMVTTSILNSASIQGVGIALYIEDVLPDRTYEKWGYEQVPQSNISGNDFPIGVK